MNQQLHLMKLGLHQTKRQLHLMKQQQRHLMKLQRLLIWIWIEFRQLHYWQRLLLRMRQQ
jgi:queuine/archaeosine tRNA-ribosyltransferase